MWARGVPALLVAVAVGAPTLVSPQGRQTSPASPAALRLDRAAQVRFLETAKVVSSTPIGKGITGALRVTLSAEGVTHDAAFQSVDERSSTSDIAQGRRRAGELRFVDSWRYNIAADRLANLLGLGAMSPPTVERRIDGKPGALTWWIDNVLMEEGEREQKNAQPPNPREFNHQRQRMFVFAQLVYDTDRNKGNVVYTRDWRVMMIDFTRAFRLHDSLREPEALQICDRALLTRMRGLTRPVLDEAVGNYLTPGERDAVMKRRELIVSHFDALIAERGEGRVLY